MKNFSAFFSMLLFLLLSVILTGCGTVQKESDSSSTLAGTMTITNIFKSPTANVSSTQLGFSPDSLWVCFEGTGGVNKVSTTPGSLPIPVGGGYRPGFLGEGSLTFYNLWIDSDHDNHIMYKNDSSPSPSILRSYNGDTIDLPHDYAFTPERLSVSADGTKAVCGLQWSPYYGVYLLQWSGSAVPVTTRISTAYLDADISRDGTLLAYVTTANTVVVRTISNSQEEIVGTGNTISWGLNKLGYVKGTFSASSNIYCVYDPATKTSKEYSYPAGTWLQCATLSWDAKKIAFRVFSDGMQISTNIGVSLGTLND